MDLVDGGNLIDGLLALDGLDRNPCLEVLSEVSVLCHNPESFHSHIPDRITTQLTPYTLVPFLGSIIIVTTKGFRLWLLLLLLSSP